MSKKRIILVIIVGLFMIVWGLALKDNKLKYKVVSGNNVALETVQELKIAPVTVAPQSSGSTSIKIDISKYPKDSNIIALAKADGEPSFMWQGSQGLMETVTDGVAGWKLLADYSTAYNSKGEMQLSRTLINASDETFTDRGYTITLLQVKR